MTDRVAGSFRDPSGFVFRHEGVIHRTVMPSYAPHYDKLMDSGLYAKLTDKQLLIPHQEVTLDLPETAGAHRVLRPQPVPFISFPYEWCFGQLKDAALLTLRMQKLALKRGMMLKDASAYNVQFLGGKPVFIDTLSFETYEEGSPWIAYGQFCQHFLAPLALIAKVDMRLASLLRPQIDGVDLDLASRLLPATSWLNFGILTHIHLHAKSTNRHAQGASTDQAKQATVSQTGMTGLIDSLKNTVQALQWNPSGTEWADYYDNTNYTQQAASFKGRTIAGWLEKTTPKTVWDLGANTGVYSKIAAETGAYTVAADIDPAAVERHYRGLKQSGATNVLPLLQSLDNPSPSLGWAHTERPSLTDRGPCDVAMALALVHHLAISNHVPLQQLGAWFATLCRHLIIEFVPRTDSQVKLMLSMREDSFPDYTTEGFEAAMLHSFEVEERTPVEGSERTLYLLRSRKLD